MNGGIHGTPWYVRVFMIVFSQTGLMGTQYLLYLQQAGMWATLGIAALQTIIAIAGAYGPGAAGALARNVGKAVRIGKSSTDVGVPPKEKGPDDP